MLRALCELLSFWDWITPTVGAGREVKQIARGEAAAYHHLFIETSDYPMALAVLQNMKIKPTEKMHDFLRREWHVQIKVPMGEMGRVDSALQRAGVRYRS